MLEHTVVIDVNLASPVDGEVKVCFETQDGSALSGVNYEYKAGELVFSAGITNQQIKLNIFNLYEQTEDVWFLINLTEITGATSDNIVYNNKYIINPVNTLSPPVVHDAASLQPNDPNNPYNIGVDTDPIVSLSNGIVQIRS